MIAAVGCGAGSSAKLRGTTGSSATSLSITYWAEGRAEGNSGQVDAALRPAAGTLPKRGIACAKLVTLQEPVRAAGRRASSARSSTAARSRR